MVVLVIANLRKLLRKDKYAKSDKIVVVGSKQRVEVEQKPEIKSQTDIKWQRLF